MTLSSALNIATSGLSASAKLAQTTSNNVSNAMTDGYARRDLALTSNALGGVRIGTIIRDADSGIIADRRLADADVGQRQAGTIALASLEQSFGVVGDEAGVAGRLAALEESLISAGSEPASEVRLNSVLSRLTAVTEAVRSDAVALKAERESADAAIADDVDTLNTALVQVEELNADISRMRARGEDPSAVMDARRVVIDRIATIVPVRLIDRGNEQVALYTASGVGLIDGQASSFTFAQTTTIDPAMSFAVGSLAGITWNGQPLSLQDGFGGLKGGSIEANFKLRDETLPAIQSNLDALAADILTRFEDPAVDPTLTPGDPGLITNRGLPLDPLNTEGLSFRLEVNAAVDPAQGGDLSRLRDGVNAAVAGPIGDAAQLDRWLGAMRDTSTLSIGGVARTLPGHAADLISDIGERRLSAEENLSFVSARQDALKTSELAMGVDTDSELQNLLRIEQAYAANARVVQTIDRMLQRLTEI